MPSLVMQLLRILLQVAMTCGLVLVLLPYCTYRVLASSPTRP